MREGWIETRLVDAVEVLDRFRKPVNSTEREGRLGSIPYYGANGQTGWIDDSIFDEELVLLGEDAIDFADPNARKAYLISGPSWVNNHAHVLRAKPEKVYSYFLAESLNKVDYSKYVSFGTRSKLTQGSMNGMTLFLPPLPQQARIVDLISSVDFYIEALQLQLESVKRSRSAVLQELLTAGGDNWEATTLGDIANWSGGITPSMANLEFWEGGNIPWISSGDIATYESEGTKKNVTQKALSDTSLKLLPSGTVIVVVRSGILIHSLPVAILQAPATINQDIKAAQPKKSIKPEFLWFLLRYLESEILSTCRKTGTTVQSISTEALLGTKIKLPPMSVQDSICEVASALDLVANQSEKLIIEANNLRSSLLSDLLSGAHEIPASYDEVLGAA
jgi:type I restriction enzyme S subunit